MSSSTERRNSPSTSDSPNDVISNRRDTKCRSRGSPLPTAFRLSGKRSCRDSAGPFSGGRRRLQCSNSLAGQRQGGGECPDQGPCAASVLASVFCELSTARSAHGTRVAPDRTTPPGPVAGGEGTITRQRLLYDFFIFYPLTLLWGGDRLCSMIVSTQPNRVLTTSRTEAAGGRRRWNCRNVK